MSRERNKHKHTHTHTRVCVYNFVYTNTHIYTIHTYIMCTHIYTYIHVRIYIAIHTYTCIEDAYIHTHIDTYTLTHIINIPWICQRRLDRPPVYNLRQFPMFYPNKYTQTHPHKHMRRCHMRSRIHASSSTNTSHTFNI
jgi:hypothetical protein